MIRKVFWVIIILLFFFIMVPLLFMVPPVQVAFQLLFGWWGFLSRTLPKVTANPSAIGMVLVCSVVMIVALHTFCSWLARTVQAGGNGAAWRWKWTFSLFASFWILFLTAMAATGLVHQVAWLASTDEPWMQRSNKQAFLTMELYNQAHALIGEATQSDWRLPETQTRFWQTADSRQTGFGSIREAFHVVFEGKENLERALLFYRNPILRDRTDMFLVIQAGSPQPEKFPLSELQQHLPGFSAGSQTPATSAAK